MSNTGELMMIALSEFEGLFKKDQHVRRAFISNYRAKMRFLQMKMNNMHMDLKFSTALIDPIDDEEEDGTMSCGSDQGGYDREDKLVAGEISKIDRLS